MDDGLVQDGYLMISTSKGVLILVVVDDGLVLERTALLITVLCRLNPCCSGRWSRTVLLVSSMKLTVKRLNPCCSGRWSRTYGNINS